jgi:RNA polymerase sigma factor (sigma-70 family)
MVPTVNDPQPDESLQGSHCFPQESDLASLLPTDEELLRSWAEGSQESFAVLFGVHSGALLAAVRRFVRSEFAEEVVQETWMAVVAKIDRFEHRGDFRAWLLAIGRNLAKRRAQFENRERSLGNVSNNVRMSWLQQEDWLKGAASVTPDPCREALAKEQLVRTRAALQRLSERDRALVRQATCETPHARGVRGSTTAARVSRFRARQRLRRELVD